MTRRRALLVAIAGLVAWTGFLALVLPGAAVDEGTHLRTVARILDGEWLPRKAGPTLPGYHWLVASVSAPWGASLGIARLCSLGAGVLTVVLLHLALVESGRGRSGWTIFRLAWLPFLLWPVARAYTDPLALCLVALALWSRGRGWVVLAAGSLLLGSFVRQTTVVWALFFAAWSALQPAPSPRLPGPRSQAAVFGAVPLLFAAALGWMGPSAPAESDAALARFGKLLMPTATEGDLSGVLGLNLGNYYNLSFAVLVLWAPALVPRLGEHLREGLVWARSHRLAALTGAGALLAIGACLAASYEVSHPWNRGFRGEKLAVLRQAPMALMDHYWSFRILGLVAFFAGAALAARTAWRQESRRLLGLVAIASLLSLAPHVLVESRYLIVPLVLWEFFADRPPEEEQRLAAWYLALTLAVSVAFAAGWTVLW